MRPRGEERPHDVVRPRVQRHHLACAEVETSPMSPTEPPPYTSRASRRASSAPKDEAAARNRGSVPDRAPQNTHTEPNPPEAGEEPIGAKRRRSEERRAWMWW